MDVVKLISCGMLASLLILGSVAFAENTNDELPFPMVPKNFEEAVYKGKKGCLQNDPRLVTAVAANAGTTQIGSLYAVQSLKDGKFHADIEYNIVSGTGYILSDKKNGTLCVIEQISNFHYRSESISSVASLNGKITDEMCAAIPYSFQGGGLCGSFSEMTARLQKNGFQIQWQAEKSDGNYITLLSSDAKTYVLTTDRSTGATVVTAASTAYPFQWSNEELFK